MQRQPTFYISHGGGPCFWMDMPPPFGAHGFDNLKQYLAQLLSTLTQKPRAILMISAHWEEAVPTVGASEFPPMIYDYYGFPPHTYELNYPAPGSPDLTSHILHLLGEAGILAASDPERGFDHGVFVPMLIMDPEAKIPLLTLSLQKGLDPQAQIEMGTALASLREENVLIIGSGNSYHNLQEFFDGHENPSKEFDDWLNNAVTNKDPRQRSASLVHWKEAPRAKACHPREEHLLPLMVASGAAGADLGRRDFHDKIGGKWISCFSFGSSPV